MLNRADWSERASNPLYGMPYYSAGNLFLAGEPSDLIARLEEVASSAPPGAAQVLDQVYGTGAGRLVPFADMLVVHELAHAFHDGVPFVFPRSWLMELFANMALYAFVVANEPDRTLGISRRFPGLRWRTACSSRSRVTSATSRRSIRTLSRSPTSGTSSASR